MTNEEMLCCSCGQRVSKAIVDAVLAQRHTGTATDSARRAAANRILHAALEAGASIPCWSTEQWNEITERVLSAIETAMNSAAAPAANDAVRDEIEAIRARAYNTPLFSAETYAHDIRRLLRLLTATKETADVTG